MEKYTLTVHAGQIIKNWNREHNIRGHELMKKEQVKDERIFDEWHIKPELSKFNVTIVDKNVEDVYSQIFDEKKENGKSIIEEWNEKQQKNRHYDQIYKDGKDYFKKLYQDALNPKKPKAPLPVLELLIQFGNVDSKPDDKLAEEMYEEFYKIFQKKYGEQFFVVGAFIHFDEVGGHHMHFDVIPIANREKKRGMEKQISMNLAAKQTLEKNNVEIKGTNIATDAPRYVFYEELRKDIEEIYKKHNIEALRNVAEGKKHENSIIFKLRKQIETLIKKLNKTNSELKETNATLDEIKERLSESEEIQLELTEDIKRLNKDKEVLEDELIKLTSNKDDLITNIEDLSNILVEKKEVLKKIKNRIKQLVELEQDSKLYLKDIEKDIVLSEEDKKELEAKIYELEAKYEKIKNQSSHDEVLKQTLFEKIKDKAQSSNQFNELLQQAKEEVAITLGRSNDLVRSVHRNIDKAKDSLR